jgi:phosphoglycerol transferase MdoB-like AlkP superfamily enzyme
MTEWQWIGAVMLLPIVLLFALRIWVWVEENPDAFREGLRAVGYMLLIASAAAYIWAALVLVSGTWP